MRFTIPTAALLRACKTASVAVAKRTSLPILEHFLLTVDGRGLTVAATDLTNAVTVTVDEIKGVQAGRATCAAALLLSLLAQCPDNELTVTLGTKLQLTGARSNFKLPVFDAEDYPVLPFDREASQPVFVTTTTALAEAVGRVDFAAIRDASRPTFEAVALQRRGDTLHLSALDGSRMAHTELAVAFTAAEMRPLLPIGRALVNALGVLPDGDLTVSASTGMLVAECGAVKVGVGLLGGIYPDVFALRPVAPTARLEVPRAALAAAARLSAMTDRDQKINLSAGSLGLSVSDPAGDIVTTIPLAVSPERPHEIALSGRYLCDALGALDGDTVTLNLIAHNKPFTVTAPDADTTLHLIMPMYLEGAA